MTLVAGAALNISKPKYLLSVQVIGRKYCFKIMTWVAASMLRTSEIFATET